jgi:dinuclear metal center YbgI/SA1388 family protein
MANALSNIIQILEEIAPPVLAEDWDNVGLQIGDARSEVRSIWVALDPSLDVVTAACEAEVDLLVTHHPLFFRPLRRIDVQSPLGEIIEMAIRHHVAVYSMHTNLDATRDGLNDWLARRLGLRRLRPLASIDRTAHRQHNGIGRVGTLAGTMTLKDLALDVKQRLNIGGIRIAGNTKLRVKRVALSTGSGGSLLDHFLASNAEVFISGDLRYHEARDIEAARRGLIDIGHFQSEHLITVELVQRLRRALGGCDPQIRVEACCLEKDPFILV